MTIPRLGLGTRGLQGTEGYTTILQALQLGYTHIDTAPVYYNEVHIGQGISDSGIARETLRLTTKIFIDNYQTTDTIITSINQSLYNLQTTYIDLVLLHRPTTHEEHHRVFDVLLGLKTQGIIKHIGVSNFNSDQLLDAINYTNNQIFAYQGEYHICLNQDTILQICKDNNIVFEAYSPLAHGKLRNNDMVMTTLTNIAAKHQTSIAQIMLSWLRTQDIILLPKSRTKEHLIENLMHSPILLDDIDIALINGFPKNFRYCNPRQIAPQRD